MPLAWKPRPEVAVRDHIGIGDPTKQDDAIPDDKSGDKPNLRRSAH